MAKRSNRTQKHKVQKIKKNTRISDYAAKVFPLLGSRTAAKKAIEQGRLLLNGRKTKPFELLFDDDVIELLVTVGKKKPKVDIPIDIIYEDDYFAVVNKPGGIAVNGNRNKTVENALADLCLNNNLPDTLPNPVAVHRLDVPTNGIVLLAKTKKALIDLSRAFQKNQVKKEYTAVVHGAPDVEGTIEDAIGGKNATTHFETIKTIPSRIFKNLSLVRLFPITGRTHQLRIHMRNQGNLIVGDKMYAKGVKTILGKGMFLCASRISFTHPISKKPMDFSIEIPKKFMKMMDREKGRSNNFKEKNKKGSRGKSKRKSR